MELSDYEAVIGLMKRTPGVSFRDADSYEATARYLERNPNLSFVAYEGSMMIGCIMSGHDGRRGYLQHLVVLPEHRRKGVASALVEECLVALENLGIQKVHIDVLKTNQSAQTYWERQGWELRTDIHRYSFIRSGNQSA